ncbi:MAG: beta-galactosidase trimerization domain-containing protein [Candidatus Omnitrophota bacterium]
MRYKIAFIIMAGNASWLLAAAPVPIVKEFAIPAKTSVPYTYCIEYLPEPENESFLQELRNSPPDLFHLGYQIPFKAALGPTYGHELFTDEILPPDQIPREIERIHRIIAKMKEAGVKRLIPYVYTMAFFGHPDKRTGFFHFYDHWDDYRDFGLGPRPDADPTLWSQVRGPMPLGGGPPDVYHYEPCVNHPGWSDYLDLVVRQLASVGYDGMFFDVNTQYCYCPYCQVKFDIYLFRKYGREGLRSALGTDDSRELNLSGIYRDFERAILEAFPSYLHSLPPDESIPGIDVSAIKLEEDWRLLRCYMQDSSGEFPPEDDLHAYLQERFGDTQIHELSADKKNLYIQTILRYRFREFLKSRELADLLNRRFGSADIRRRCRSNPRDLLLWVETQRFWCESMASTHARLKQVGRSIFASQGRRDDFYTVANLGSMQTVDALNKRRVDGIDLVHFAPMSDMQMFEEMPQPGSLESGVIISNVFAFRWAMAAGTRAGTLLYKVMDDRSADLAQAEAAAGGGGAFIQGGLGAPKSRERWKRFFAEHSDLWNGGDSGARAGLLFWSDQVFYEYPEHLAMTHRLVRIFSETQIPFDIITEEGLSRLSQYDVVFAPMLRYAEEPQIHQLLSYAESGGCLAVIDPFGTENHYAQPRPSHPLSNVSFSADEWKIASYGKGKILNLQPEHIPSRLSDSWRLMEERSNSFVLAGDFLNKARRIDREKQVDLGSSFIKRLEQTLQIPLRWCPPNTDAGIYIHPYILPGKEKQPDRMVVHIVNYHIPILLEKEWREDDDPIWNVKTKSGDPAIHKSVHITIPLREKREIQNAQAFSPTDTIQPISWESKSGCIAITLPELKIYQAVVIEFKNKR